MKKSFLILSTSLLIAVLFSCSSNSDTITVETEGGEQIWMSKNLNVDKFRNGDPITHAKTDDEWIKACINKEPVWCYYDNDPKNGELYGKLYNWYAIADDFGNAKNLAPAGFHIPTSLEWRYLIQSISEKGWDAESKGSAENSKLDAKASNMKSTTWKGSSNGAYDGSNISGFSALPGGARQTTFDSFGELDDLVDDPEALRFRSAGEEGFWWCSSVNHSLDGVGLSNWGINIASAKQSELTKEWSIVGQEGVNEIVKLDGYSVRCLKGEGIQLPEIDQSDYQ